MPTTSNSTDIRLPVASLGALRRALTEAVGADAAATALQKAGYAAGDAVFQHLAGALEGADIADLPLTEYFDRLARVFRQLGWGDMRHEAVHDGIGALHASDWFEPHTVTSATRPSCFFTTGLLANLLGRTAGADVAVLQAECRARGDDHCRFLFGSPDALSAIYGHLADGESVEASLASLG
ncbi:MAG TPA: V4R domain-containing protein [Longimicrobiales bacterium]|nr:V4R domain-containing protein [Longimicrobiales bacterium]